MWTTLELERLVEYLSIHTSLLADPFARPPRGPSRWVWGPRFGRSEMNRPPVPEAERDPRLHAVLPILWRLWKALVGASRTERPLGLEKAKSSRAGTA